MIYSLWLFLTLSIIGVLAYAIHLFGAGFAGGLLVGFTLTQLAVRIKFRQWL